MRSARPRNHANARLFCFQAPPVAVKNAENVRVEEAHPTPPYQCHYAIMRFPPGGCCFARRNMLVRENSCCTILIFLRHYKSSARRARTSGSLSSLRSPSSERGLPSRTAPKSRICHVLVSKLSDESPGVKLTST